MQNRVYVGGRKVSFGRFKLCGLSETLRAEYYQDMCGIEWRAECRRFGLPVWGNGDDSLF